MTIEVISKRSIQKYDQFDPFTDSDIQFFHVECEGGKVQASVSEKSIEFKCKACGMKSDGWRAPHCREIIRKVVITGSQAALGENLSFISEKNDSRQD